LLARKIAVAKKSNESEGGQKFRTEILNLKTAKEPDKNISSNCMLILGKENFSFAILGSGC